MSKLTFDLFRFHLIPLSTSQVSLEFENSSPKLLSYDQLVDMKNSIFNDLVKKLTESKTDFPVIKFTEDDSNYLFGIANEKKTLIINDFKESEIITQPFVYVAINTDSDSQKIAISRDTRAFSNTNVVKNILTTIFRKHLNQYGLSIEIEPLFEVNSFWKLTEKHKGKIKEVDFEIVKPNMSRISKSIKDTLKPLILMTNSHKTNLKLEAPKEGVLENINKENEQVKGLVDYASEGGGEVSMKIVGLRKKITSNKMHKFVEVREVNIKGAADQIVKVWKDIID